MQKCMLGDVGAERALAKHILHQRPLLYSKIDLFGLTLASFLFILFQTTKQTVRKEVFMTIQEAAYKILEEMGKPTSSKEISRIALERRMVSSTAKDPIQSHAQTIEKNVRDDIYNSPKLVFLNSSQGRLIGLPAWDSSRSPATDNKIPNLSELRIHVSTKLLEKIKLAEQAKLKNSFDETVAFILTKGLSILSPEIKKGLMEQLDSLNSL